ncbi:response regulator receiver domain-containing protein [Azospirillum brasilense]|uniref:Response regulator receiver domain-containing protein n=1 Tax=Azospirillum brasilense TaxID=192 RepID=A0A560BPW5_AZOBR|nr:response regulator [Azospirillum brasilense]TWA74664.1 response regulator receiver domain-containing protein [Azospirillum brasilense]
MKLLVVEDDPLIGPAIKAVMENAGYTVVGPLRDAAKATRLGVREQPDLALVDVYLAGGENGLTLARKLWEEHNIPSLLITGFDHRGEEARDFAVGLLRKPVMPDALVDAVGAVGEILAGLRPSSIPPALELFGRPERASAAPGSAPQTAPQPAQQPMRRQG